MFLFLTSLILAFGLIWSSSPFPVLLTLHRDVNVSLVPDCHEHDMVSCVFVTVDFEALKAAKVGDNLTFPDGMVLTKKSHVDVDDYVDGLVFEDQGADRATLTLTPSTDPNSDFDQLDGLIIYQNGMRKLYHIDNCGMDCHVLVESNPANMDAKHDVLMPPANMSEPENRDALYESESLSRMNANTMYTVNVYFYYTAAMARARNIQSYVNTLVAMTNTGYQNSGINVRIRAFCIEELRGFSETNDPSGMLNSFTNRGLNRGTADIAILLVSRVYDGTCGIAWFNSGLRSSLNYAVVMNGCPDTVTGHEIGHLYGSCHNREIDSGCDTAYGKRINTAAGRASGYHTIMAYGASGYRADLNCYSGDNLFCNGLETGDARNDVRNLIVSRREQMSRMGNENGQCNGISGVTTEPPYTRPPPATDSCILEQPTCPGWASKGFCTQTKNNVNLFMRDYCKQSCNLCPPVQGTTKPPPTVDSCVSEKSQCADWARKGFCISTANNVYLFMRDHCKRSCKLCL